MAWSAEVCMRMFMYVCESGSACGKACRINVYFVYVNVNLCLRVYTCVFLESCSLPQSMPYVCIRVYSCVFLERVCLATKCSARVSACELYGMYFACTCIFLRVVHSRLCAKHTSHIHELCTHMSSMYPSIKRVE